MVFLVQKISMVSLCTCLEVVFKSTATPPLQKQPGKLLFPALVQTERKASHDMSYHERSG